MSSPDAAILQSPNNVSSLPQPSPTTCRSRSRRANIGITTCLLLLHLFAPCPGEALYFAQSEWRVTVPINFPVQSPLARIVVVRGALETENATWHYEIETANPSNLGIEVSSNSGVVYLTKPLTNNATGLSITLTIAVKSALSEKVQTEVHIDVVALPTSLDTWCLSRAAEEACLLPSGANFRLVENDPQQLIGTVGFLGYRSLCPNNAVRYWIQSDDNALKMNDETGEVWTQRPFDRESAHDPLAFTYGCNVTQAGNVTVYVRQGALLIEDVNDNGPELQNGQEFELYLDSDVPVNKPLDFGTQILLKDKDSRRSDYAVEVIGDVEDFLNVVIEEITFNDAPKEVFRKANLIVKRPLIFPGDSYRFSLIFKDVTLLPGNGDNQAMVNIVIHNKTTSSTVFQQYDISVYKNATKYAKVLGPFHKHLGKATEIKFSLESDSKEAKWVFNVTPTQGIIYVVDPSRLRALNPGPLGLRLAWSFPATASLNNATWINVTILPEPDAATENITNSCDPVKSCAEIREIEACGRSCGPGSPRGGCQWRSVSVKTTCVSNLVTCPDRQCDELESLDWNLCPQDCAVLQQTNGSVPHPVCAGGPGSNPGEVKLFLSAFLGLVFHAYMR